MTYEYQLEGVEAYKGKVLRSRGPRSRDRLRDHNERDGNRPDYSLRYSMIPVPGFPGTRTTIP